MDQPPEDQPPRRHVDEVAWMREAKHQRAIDERLDWKEYYLQHPDYPGHANDNTRKEWIFSTPESSPEIDAALDQLVSGLKEAVTTEEHRQPPLSSQNCETDKTSAQTNAQRKLEELKRARDLIATVVGPRRSIVRQQAAGKLDHRGKRQHKRDGG